jgi:hypothetical protein
MAATAVLRKNGDEWRILLGRCDNWPNPAITSRTAEATVAIELCEVCRQPVGNDKPYVTNSAGERPVHLACSGD